ncbi:MAG: aminotransferase class I/II-fold pyridoxal phosphate-dependent enzyme [Chloroflexi bacterium]|nr:aminotransferase class I/II-fold pyridoxal phosphate-dependent enzyme [Chloroflexota bacterium]
MARYLSTDDAMLSRYGSVSGFMPLRQALADYLARYRSLNCTPEQIVIVSGAQQVLNILARLLLQPGDEVLVETPGYVVAFDPFRAYGLRLTALPVDDEGLSGGENSGPQPGAAGLCHAHPPVSARRHDVAAPPAAPAAMGAAARRPDY